MAHSGGMIQGAAAGSSFGPAGVVFGALAGGIFGAASSSRRRKKELEMLKANTKLAYTASESEFSYLAKTEKDIAKKYATDSATQIAQMAASGVQLTPDMLNRIEGRTGRVRDEALTKLGIDRDRFTGGEAYKFLEKDYNYLAKTDNAKDNDTGAYTSTIQTVGRSGESFYTEEQRGNLRQTSLTVAHNAPGQQAQRRRIEEYAQNLAPTFEEFQTGRFGTEDEQAQFVLDTDARIESANVQFDNYFKKSEQI